MAMEYPADVQFWLAQGAELSGLLQHVLAEHVERALAGLVFPHLGLDGVQGEASYLTLPEPRVSLSQLAAQVLDLPAKARSQPVGEQHQNDAGGAGQFLLLYVQAAVRDEREGVARFGLVGRALDVQKRVGAEEGNLGAQQRGGPWLADPPDDQDVEAQRFAAELELWGGVAMRKQAVPPRGARRPSGAMPSGASAMTRSPKVEGGSRPARRHLAECSGVAAGSLVRIVQAPDARGYAAHHLLKSSTRSNDGSVARSPSAAVATSRGRPPSDSYTSIVCRSSSWRSGATELPNLVPLPGRAA
jgi:hypothetical protein